MAHNDQFVKQHRNRNQKMRTADQGLEKGRQFAAGQPLESQLGGLDVRDVKKRRIRGESRYGSRLDHIDIGHVHILGNDESGRSHNRRCQLPVGAGSHLNCGRFFGRIAHFLH